MVWTCTVRRTWDKDAEDGTARKEDRTEVDYPP